MAAPVVVHAAVSLAVLAAGFAPALAADLPVDPGATPLPVPWWVARDVPTARDLHAVDFHDARLGWVGADDGVVYRTHDGGATWHVRHTGLMNPVVALDFVDDRHGFAATSDRGLARTTDGGDTWQVLDAGGWLGWFNEIRFLDAQTGFGLGATAISRGYIEKTTDGGATWEWLDLQFERTESSFFRVDFSEDASRLWVLGWIFGEGTGVARSFDGGATWAWSGFAGADFLRDIEMVSDTHGVAVGNLGQVFRTEDGGATWAPVLAPTVADLADVAFLDATRGFAVGDAGTILATSDGGRTWSVEVAGAPLDLAAAAFAPDGHGWAIATDGAVRHRQPGLTVDALVAETITLPSGTPHPPILVTGDDGFASPLSGVVRGSGTPDDPYVIEGYDIVPAATDAVTLVGTRAHVVIRANVLHDAVGDHAGVRLVDARNVRVEANHLRALNQGVVVDGGEAIAVAGNAIRETERTAVAVTRAARVTIEGNEIFGSGLYGVDVAATTDAVVAGNTLVYNRFAGVRLSAIAGVGSAGARVEGNVLQDNGDGIRATLATSPVIQQNVVVLSEDHGVNVELTTGAVVRANAFVSNTDAEARVGTGSAGTLVEANAMSVRKRGVLLDGDRDTLVRANDVKGHVESDGVRTVGSLRARIEGNAIDGNGVAIRLTGGTADSVVRANHLLPGYWGVELEGGSTRNLIEGNEVTSRPTDDPYDAAHDGVVIMGKSHANVVRANHVHRLWVGLSVIGESERNVVEGNFVHDILFNGIDVGWHAHETTLRNNTVENVGRYGIWLNARADRLLVEDNVVRNATHRGISLGTVSSSVLRGNVVQNASVGLAITDECPFGEVDCDSADNVVTHNTFEDVRNAALLVYRNGRGRVVDLEYAANQVTRAAVAWNLTEAVRPVLHGNNLDGVAVGLVARASGEVDAAGNWWGAADGPSGDGPGSGASVRALDGTSVRYEPWLAARAPGAGA